ncbi:MAG: ABC transporter ATP-binding protein [Gracilibacteraceae bacterium]|jgi:ABC-2 type transport system ATP-binding protein|nr:ABC transporter ATP-binding protein [Gracilibacteraceae bacterium]
MEGKKKIIRTENLSKRYGNHTAVDGLNLEITEGEVYGLLGPNGAGKTTTILMLLGLTEPTDGTVWVNDFNSTRDPIAVKRIVSYLPDNVGFYEDMTGRENLMYTARLNSIEDAEADKKIKSLAVRVGLAEYIDNKVATYSKGMRQRLGIADVLIKDPRIVIMDEPTFGIDPKGIGELLELIRELSEKDGRTVLVSSHHLHQMEKICDRVGIFVNGKLIASGPIDTLWKQVSHEQGHIVELRAEPDTRELGELIRNTGEAEEVLYDRGMYTVISKTDIRQKLVRSLSDNGFSLMHLRIRGGDLDDIYRRYFAREGVV